MSKIADGITFRDTPSHGYIILSAARNEQVHPAWRDPAGSYEEDCEAYIVVVTFPEAFPNTPAEEAHQACKAWYPDKYEQVFGVEVTPEESHIRRRQLAQKEHAGDWVAVVAFGDWHPDVPKGYVGIGATLGGHRESGLHTIYRLVRAEQYDTQQTAVGYIVTRDDILWDGPGTGYGQTKSTAQHIRTEAAA